MNALFPLPPAAGLSPGPFQEVAYGAAFLTGLLGSGHCLGMCGGLVSAFFLRLQARGPWPYLAYHAGRLGIYTLVGFIAALLGTVLVSSGRIGLAQGLLQMVAGLAVILLGLELLGRTPWQNRLGFAPFAWLFRQFGAAGRRGPLVGALLGGALNGLMPCSMTLAMAVQASTAPTPAAGALLLLCFGAGTLPAMLPASWLFGRLGLKARSRLLKAAACTVILLGLATFWQGCRYFLVMYRLVS
jgi:sulfite exporter TauE/SafE